MASRQGSCGFALRWIRMSPRRPGWSGPPRSRRWLPLLRLTWALASVASLLGLPLMAATVTAERTLRGTSGSDLLLGDSAPNVISGGRSADQLYGRAGNDSIRGGTAPDWIDGGSGDDYLYGDEA